ncbi:uncharacterized protein L203_105288 [Cryptococcus depauperatus CBS 7841]|uniref:Uncharacterized protein n=1 Tax=Cryptococcus depauperatus CBS 7841 TaxID=1295531 RepID=A0A1E3HYJ0_9TREE|nr:hypothetical protein L203_05659 [Cryptococcus depauperatus CBS 7841]
MKETDDAFLALGGEVARSMAQQLKEAGYVFTVKSLDEFVKRTSGTHSSPLVDHIGRSHSTLQGSLGSREGSANHPMDSNAATETPTVTGTSELVLTFDGCGQSNLQLDHPTGFGVGSLLYPNFPGAAGAMYPWPAGSFIPPNRSQYMSTIPPQNYGYYPGVFQQPLFYGLPSSGQLAIQPNLEGVTGWNTTGADPGSHGSYGDGYNAWTNNEQS